MFCYVTLYDAVLCFAMLCYAYVMLCYVIGCYSILCYGMSMLCYVTLRHWVDVDQALNGVAG